MSQYDIRKIRFTPYVIFGAIINAGIVVVLLWTIWGVITGSVYSETGPIFDTFIICIIIAVILGQVFYALKNDQVMYIPGEVRKDILKTKRDESSIIGVFPARDQGKYFVEIAWIPPRIDSVKIKAFHVYSWRHFYLDVIFNVSVRKTGCDGKSTFVGKMTEAIIPSTNYLVWQRRARSQKISFPFLRKTESSEIEVNVVSRYSKASDASGAVKDEPVFEQYRIKTWWAVTIREWIELKRSLD